MPTDSQVMTKNKLSRLTTA